MGLPAVWAYRTKLDCETETLDSGLCFDLAEDRVGLVPWWDGWRWGTGAAFDLNTPCHTTTSRCGSEKSFSLDLMKEQQPDMYLGHRASPGVCQIRAAVTPPKLRRGCAFLVCATDVLRGLDSVGDTLGKRICFIASLPSDMLCQILFPPQKFSQRDTVKTHFQVLKQPGDSTSKCLLHDKCEVSASPWFWFSGLE